MAVMTNIASLLKSEMARLARKEVRSQTSGLKKAVATYRSEIAALKRRAGELEQQLRRLSKARRASGSATDNEAAPAKALRFTAKGLAAQRRRLGLSAHDCGLLVGASGQSVYNWEDGKARPRAGNLVAIAALRSMGKKQAAQRLAALHAAAGSGKG